MGHTNNPEAYVMNNKMNNNFHRSSYYRKKQGVDQSRITPQKQTRINGLFFDPNNIREYFIRSQLNLYDFYISPKIFFMFFKPHHNQVVVLMVVLINNQINKKSYTQKTLKSTKSYTQKTLKSTRSYTHDF